MNSLPSPRGQYEPPQLFVMGRLADVTLGGAGSRCDGFSGNQGNHGRRRLRCGPKPGKPGRKK